MMPSMRGDDLEQKARDERLELITTELRRRIRCVCQDMPDEMYFELIESMAAIQLKYELLDKPAPD